MAGRLTLDRRALMAHAQMLVSLSYQSVLRRGFALVRDADGHAVRSVAGLVPGARVGIEFADGDATATLTGISPSSDGGEQSGGDIKRRGARAPQPRRRSARTRRSGITVLASSSGGLLCSGRSDYSAASRLRSLLAPVPGPIVAMRESASTSAAGPLGQRINSILSTWTAARAEGGEQGLAFIGQAKNIERASWRARRRAM